MTSYKSRCLPDTHTRWECNLAAVWGQVTTGEGYNPLEESMATLGVPEDIHSNRKCNRREVQSDNGGGNYYVKV